MVQAAAVRTGGRRLGRVVEVLNQKYCAEPCTHITSNGKNDFFNICHPVVTRMCCYSNMAVLVFRLSKI